MINKKTLAEYISENNIEAVKRLTKGKSFKGKDGGIAHYDSDESKYYDTAATLAVKNRNIDILRLVIASGLDLEATDYPCMETPLELAVEANSIQMVDLLLNGGVKLCKSKALFKAVQAKNIEMCELLLRHGADPTHKFWDSSMSSEEISSIELATLLSDTEDICNLLLSYIQI